jgi:diguanylate cyclase (GGDEF)-like protein
MLLSMCAATIIPAVISGMLSFRSARLMKELTLTRSELSRISQTDQLTGLLNRRGFDDEATRALHSAYQASMPAVVFMCDIDHFKSINDRYGHAAGDRVIVQVADGCRAKRSSDIVARIGGEEFAMLLPETSLAEACAVAERLRKTVAERSIMLDGVPLQVTVSVGVAEAHPDFHGIPDLLKRADQALYEAKRTGRNRICVSGAGDAGSATAA